MNLSNLRSKAKDAIRYTIEECGIIDINKVSIRNKQGIKIQSSYTPKNREGINDWFKRFTV